MPDCEVLVLGGGPAGTLITLILARSGKDVIQVATVPAKMERPYEVLAPSTRRLLAKHGLAEPVQRTANCRGVLSHWGTDDIEFHDYTLVACSSGLTIDRNIFHESLVKSACAAGAKVLRGGRVRSSQTLCNSKAAIEVAIDGEFDWIAAEWVVDATGRQAGRCAPTKIHRQYFDSLIALSTPFETLPHQDYLLVEAVPEGWWYVPPSIDGHTQLVFLTDADLLPRGAFERREWLSNRYRSSKLLPSVAKIKPCFLELKGTDCRFSRISEVMLGQWVAVGDAALALDPLSGTGTWNALTGAEHLALELCGHIELGMRYTDWWRQSFEREWAVRSEVYSQASSKFPNSPFWQRRSASTSAA